MQDSPTPDEILEVVAKLMRETVMPELAGRSVYLTRVAANALDLVRRQIQLTPNFECAEWQRLRAMLGKEGSLEELNCSLCESIESGTITADTPGLSEHLWSTALEKLAVDQPTYTPYKHLIDQN